MRTDEKTGRFLPAPSITERLHQRLDKTEDCWVWQGATIAGYGYIRDNSTNGGRMMKAHRVMWESIHGPIPEGLYVCHSCDNRPCCKPDHLWLGTHDENVADCKGKGRTPSGDRSGRRKYPERWYAGKCSPLTPADVRIIRARVAAGEWQKVVAASYGIAPNTVSSIVHRHTWASVE